MENGFLKIQRRLFSHWLWNEKRSLSKFEAWLDLLQLAAFVPTKRLVKGKLVEIAEGEAIASIRFLAERWDWNKNRVSDFLSVLEEDGMLGRRTGHGETVLTLSNYKEYNACADDSGTVTDTKLGQSRDTSGTAVYI